MSATTCNTCGNRGLTFNGQCETCYARTRQAQRTPAETHWFDNDRRGLSGGNHRGAPIQFDDDYWTENDRRAYGDFRHIGD